MPNEYQIGVSKRFYSLFEQECNKLGQSTFLGGMPLHGTYYVFYIVTLESIDMNYLKIKYDLIGAEEFGKLKEKDASHD